ncbi:uncharacterized protein LOC121978617 [Zingiber officinale]|uniref:uncharacterized protein LOC121978617 n=1 Tax=Zingiber officinale TaxID=94328 RepID=UPI001C4BF136|nr:uncharacterized protein LOC121978617 [Zingiber officinale]
MKLIPSKCLFDANSEHFLGYIVTKRGIKSNGQVEVTNREILKGLQARLEHVRGSLVDEHPSVIWAFHTTPKEATGVTPFQLVYGGEAVLPIEVGVEFDQVQLYDEENAKRRLMELDLVDESWDKATIQLMAYRQRMRQNYN